MRKTLKFGLQDNKTEACDRGGKGIPFVIRERTREQEPPRDGLLVNGERYKMGVERGWEGGGDG
jgi:hypothetical protein